MIDYTKKAKPATTGSVKLAKGECINLTQTAKAQAKGYAKRCF